MLARLVPLAVFATVVVASLIVAGLVVTSRSAEALPPAGEDLVIVEGSVSVESRIGSETIALVGTVNIQRGAPFMDGAVEVQDLTILGMNLEGESLTGPVTVSQSQTMASTGEVRSKSAVSDFPASSFLDVFVDADVPASPGPTNPLTLHNQTAIHLQPASNINAWPPAGATYQGTFNPCIPLFPTQPAEVCVTALSFTMLSSAPGNPTYSVAPNPASDLHPADLLALSPGFANTPTPTATPTPGGATNTPAPTPTGTPPADVPNDDFEDRTVIASLPFTAFQNTAAATVEPDEPLTEDSSDPFNAQCFNTVPGIIGATVWYQFTAAASGNVTVSTNKTGTNYDTVLAVYTGANLGVLQLVSCNDDSMGLQASTSFAAVAGTTYHIQVGGYAVGDPNTASRGNLEVNVTASGGGGSEPAGSAGGIGATGLITCANLGLTANGCDDGGDGTQDSIDALSFGDDFDFSETDLVFSVAPGSAGLAATGVAGQAACSPAEPQADVFATTLDGSNELLFDGNGLNGDCPTASSLGLEEGADGDDVDAFTDQPPAAVDPDNDSVPESPVFFSLAAGSPTLDALALSPADILYSVSDSTPIAYASSAALGLQAGDDVNAVCINDTGAGVSFGAGDTLYFSLAAGSPSLAAIGASAADVLAPGPVVVHEAATLGLDDDDDLDALDCFSDQPPTPTPTATATRTATRTPTPTPPAPEGTGDVNKDGDVTAVDVTLLLQYVAGLFSPINQSADVNLDGDVTSVDGTLILQFIAGLIDELPV